MAHQSLLGLKDAALWDGLLKELGTVVDACGNAVAEVEAVDARPDGSRPVKLAELRTHVAVAVLHLGLVADCLKVLEAREIAPAPQ